MTFDATVAEPKRKARIYDPGVLVPLHELPDTHQAIVYIRNRGFDPARLERLYGVAYCLDGKSFAGGVFNTSNTIAIPLYEDGRTVGWQCRLLYNPDSLTEDECAAFGFRKKENGRYLRPPKYFTSPGLQKSTILFNQDWARGSEVVVVTEGVFDALSVGLCGVATLGKQVSDEQVKKLSRWRLVVLLLDPDAASDQDRLARRFPSDVLVVSVRLSGYKDAGECPRDELWRQIGESVDGNPYIRNAGLSLASFKTLIDTKT